MRGYHYIIILIVVTLFLSLFGLGNMALTEPDETFYAQTAKEMLNAGEWITPRIFGNPQFEKPILFYLLVMISYIVFGITEFAARFPSVVLGLAGVLGVYFTGRFLFSPLCGFLSGLVLATGMQYIILARACVTDMTLMVFILFSLYFFIKGWTKEKKMYFMLASAMAAFAVLTKGPIGLFIPGVVAMVYVIGSKQWNKLKTIPYLRCALVFLAVCLPWYAVVTQIHGWTFINDFFGFQNITRFLEAEHRTGTSPFYYIPVVLAGFFPWSVFLPSGVWYMYKKDTEPLPVKAHRLFLFSWILMVFLFFSASSTKLVTYIFPLFPALALVTGRFWESFILKAREGNALKKQVMVSSVVLAVCGISALVGAYFFVQIKYDRALSGIIPVAALFAAGMAVSLILLARGKRLFSFYSIAGTVLLIIVPTVIAVFPEVEEFEGSKVLSHKVLELSGGKGPIGGESDHRRGIAFYTDRTNIYDIHPYDDLKKFIARKEQVWGIIQLKHYVQLKEELGDAVSEPLFQSGRKVIFTNRP